MIHMASPSARRHALPAPRHRRTLSSTIIEESVAAAAALVQKWHPDDDAPASGSLFLHATETEHEEAQIFLRAAAALHRAMFFFASDVTHGGDGLVQAQALLQTAMRRLDLELQLLLDDMTQSDDIRAVVEAMVAAGYGKECISTFKSHRRAALSTELQRLLGLSPPYHQHLHKLAWEQLDGSIIPSWLAAAAVAFNSLFAAEKGLCDAVFAGGNAAVGEAVFAAVANDQATGLLAVAEAAVARARRAPERLFRVLDVHDTLTGEVLPGLLSVFGGINSSEVARRAAHLVAKVGEAARGTLGSLEAAIQKEPSKATAAGGAVHPLTRYVMNYLVFLADYQEGLALLVNDDYEQEPSSSSSPSSSIILHCLVSVLLGKLEAKAGCYRELALSYLFLANNTQYVANKVAGSGKLRGILGDGWAEAQSAKARAHVGVYVRAAWGKVMAAISGAEPPEAVEQAVMEAVAMQEQWVAADEETAQALRAAATAAVVPRYRMFYRRYGAAVRLTPGDVTTMIAALFAGPPGDV